MDKSKNRFSTPCEQSLLLSFSLVRRRKVGSARIASTRGTGDLMAARHVVIRLSLFIVLVALKTHLLDAGKTGLREVISGLFHFLAMLEKKVTIFPVFTWPTRVLLKRSSASLLLSFYLLAWISQSSLSHGLTIGLMIVSLPSRAMFYSGETVQLVEVVSALLSHLASPSKGGLTLSHQTTNACGYGFALRDCPVHSLASSLVLCIFRMHPLTNSGLVLVISSSVLTLSPHIQTAGWFF